MQKTDIAAFYKEMFDVTAEADDADGGVDEDVGAVNVAVVEQALKASPRRCRKSGKRSATVTEEEKTEPRRKRGKGTKRDAEEEPEKKDNAATEVAPMKRGRKADATVADEKEEE